MRVKFFRQSVAILAGRWAITFNVRTSLPPRLEDLPFLLTLEDLKFGAHP